MSRVKRGVTSHARHKKVYKAAKGFRGRRKNTIRAAKAAVVKAGQYAVPRSQAQEAHALRALWIQRTQCRACVEHGAATSVLSARRNRSRACRWT